MTKHVGRKITFSIVAPSTTISTGVASTDLITSTAHGLAVDDAVAFPSLTGGAGLVTNKRYYVLATGLTANDFKVSLSKGGAAVDFTTNITAGSVAKFNTVGQVTGLGDVGSARELIDGSAYGDDWKDFLVGQQEGTEFDVVLAYDPANTVHQALKAAYDAAAGSTLFGMTQPVAGLDMAFPALITGYTRGGEKDGLLRATATLKIVYPGVTDTP